MISEVKRRWLIAGYFLVIPTVNLQVQTPLFAMAQMFAFPAPQVAMPCPVPFPVVIPDPRRNIITITTTERSVGIAFPLPMPVPLPVQFAVPAMAPPAFCLRQPRATNCPPCPPCLCSPCTPSFFSYCSPCHQKCRCRDRNDAPVPLPADPPAPLPGSAYPLPVPVLAAVESPSAVFVPFSPPRPQGWSGSEEYFSSSSSSESTDRKRRGRRKMMQQIPFYRRSRTSIEIGGADFVKPVLSYLSQDGEVRLERRLSIDEAAELMENRVYQKVQVVAGDDEGDDKRQRMKVVSTIDNQPTSTGNHRRRQLTMKSGWAQHMLGQGKKELIFRTPADKKITNLSMSFQII